MPCHFKVLRELIPFFSDFGTFDPDSSSQRVIGVDDPRDDSSLISSQNRFHVHNPFRPPSHVTFAELSSVKDGLALRSIIELCYTNKLEIHDENVVSTYKVANLLHMKDLCKISVEQMGKEITLDNAVKYWTAADGNESVCSSVVEDLNDITQISRDLCTTQFGKLNTEQIISLSLDQLRYLLEKEDLGVESEDQVFTAVMRWLEINANVMLKSEPDTIHHMAVELIPLIRLPQCSFGRLVQLEKFAQRLEFSLEAYESRKLMKLALLAQRLRISLTEHLENNETMGWDGLDSFFGGKTCEEADEGVKSLSDISDRYRTELPAFLSTIDALDLDDWSFIDIWMTKRTQLFGV